MTNPDSESTDLLAFSLVSVYSRNCTAPRDQKRCICVRVGNSIASYTSTILRAVYACIRTIDPRISA